MPEIEVQIEHADDAQMRERAQKHNLSEVELVQQVFLLGLVCLEIEQQTRTFNGDWEQFADQTNLQLMDIQTRHGRLTYSRFELEYDLRIMEMRKNSIEIEIHGIRYAVARCEELRRNLQPPEPVVQSNGFTSKLRRKWRDLFGKDKNEEN